MHNHEQSLQDELQALGARQAIQQCLATHSRGVDRADLELLRSAYHADATVDYGFFTGPATDMAQILVTMLRQTPVTLHRPSNTWIRIAGDTALSESYVIAYAESSSVGESSQNLVGGRYLDRFEKRDGRWKLSHRAYVLDWTISRPGAKNSAEGSIASGHFVPFGAHGAQDPGNLFLAMQFAGFNHTSVEGSSMSATALTAGDVDAILSRQVLQDLLLAYCRAVDRGDAQLLASIFHDDSTVISGVLNCNGKDFARDIISHVRDNTLQVFHTVSNQWIEINGDSAVGEAYVIACQTAQTPEGVVSTLVGGRYLDRFERRNDEWKIAHHTFVMDWNMSQPASTPEGEDPYANMARGGRKPDDPLYGFWAL